MLYLRPHHLLCLKWFVGEGYSSDFTRNMHEILFKLNNTNQEFTLTLENDNICSKCPNLNSSHICTSAAKVSIMDAKVIKYFSLTPSKTYNYIDIKKKFEDSIPTEAINDICGNCEWFSLNLCWR
ncbi:DUF1284 domain-containing protein [Clostridium paridis]|uniref:DUF1284 domain-containing protein n=1 Tax=Clostridium paridis TaxID=2803863 RepID=A0A937FDR0_9CLOT|nr:DUF1284 domain-containing protein [Clostridium paridis]MBL4930422.1 DUF1284 domain-containing protein [Clostridium paridis]